MRVQSQGFTLVETLVAAVILSFVLLGIAPMFVHAIGNNAAGADMGQVGALAVERMERLRGTDYKDLDAGGSLSSDVTVSGSDYFDRSAPGYVVRWQIANNATANGGKLITVRALALRQVSGREKDVTLTSVRGGL